MNTNEKTAWWVAWLKRPGTKGWFLDVTYDRPRLAHTREDMREFVASYRGAGWKTRPVKVTIPRPGEKSLPINITEVHRACDLIDQADHRALAADGPVTATADEMSAKDLQACLTALWRVGQALGVAKEY